MMSNMHYTECPVCKANNVEIGQESYHVFVHCDSCGRFIIRKDNHSWEEKPHDFDRLASYLYYNGKIKPPIKVHDEECFYNLIGDEKEYEFFTNEERRECYQVTDAIVENWYPKTFSEKVDVFLLGLAQKANYMGEVISLSDEEWLSACFVKRSMNDDDLNRRKLSNQVSYFVDYLKKKEYVNFSGNDCMILPEGQKRIDDLQKKEAENSKNIFVAMAFSEDMEPVRKAIKEAIKSSGYLPRIMDEIQHNHQIVPEMLYEIRKAKCVIAELSNHNNGAYYEAGFALGTGKEVIHLCRKSSFGADGHFDVKQINTILWDSEEEIVKKLADRIKATIG